LDEQPDVQAPIVLQHSQWFPVPGNHRVEPRRCALELFVRLGARSLYGLLGASLQPKDSEELVLLISENADAGGLYEASLSSSFGDVRKGLPKQYVEALMRVVRNEEASLELLGGGILSFDCAAHGVVGSAPAVFQVLASAVISLLRTEPPWDDRRILDAVIPRLNAALGRG
jgi:hypothetical protein